MVRIKTQLSQVHWDLVFKTAVVIYIVTLILGLSLSVLLLKLMNGGPPNSQPAAQAAFLVTALLVIVVTGHGALWVARRVERAALLHGFLVGLVVALLSFVLDLIFSRQANLSGGILYLLMVAAGFLGGVLGSRGREHS
jgi:putative membrane protein (TIGR04086 family)